MDRQIIVFTSDKRQEQLATLLGNPKICNKLEEMDETEKVCEKIYVLPTQVSKLEQNQGLKEKLKEELIKLSGESETKVKVFGGALNTEWVSFFQAWKIPYWDFMKLPEVVEGNGWITAEGTIAEIIKYSNYSIRNQKILVTGYGCCGKKIAESLAALGANVVVAARREEVCEEVRRDGYQAVSFQKLEEGLEAFQTVVNTVPALVLKENHIRMLSSDALIVDIASKPGGTDFAAAEKYGIKAILALGLPGIYTTTSSALLLKNAISRYAPLRDFVKGDKLWIYQIII